MTKKETKEYIKTNSELDFYLRNCIYNFDTVPKIKDILSSEPEVLQCVKKRNCKELMEILPYKSVDIVIYAMCYMLVHSEYHDPDMITLFKMYSGEFNGMNAVMEEVL